MPSVCSKVPQWLLYGECDEIVRADQKKGDVLRLALMAEC